MGGPLQHLRVVDLTDDLGRFATKLLAESGASVVRVHTGRGVTSGPAMAAPAAAGAGLLDWWYDGGKSLLPLDVDTPAGADGYRRLAAGADLIVENEVPGRLAALGLDHADLVAGNPRLVQVSLTPFGRTGPWAHWQSSDLVAGALGGVLSVSGTAEQAQNPWGRQNQHFGSFVAVISGLAAVRSARLSGRGQLVDVSLHEVVASSIEQLWFEYFYDDVLPLTKIAPRQGSLHWLRAYVVTECLKGWCMITPTPAPGPLIEWLAEHDVPGAAELLGVDPGDILGHLEEVMDATRRFCLTKDAGELFTEAQARHVAFGEVQSVAQVATNPQFAFRGFIKDVEGTPVRRPGHPVVYSATPVDAPAAPVTVAVDGALAAWGERPAPPPAAANPAKPLEGVRVVDFTWVLAGPFCNRMLGDLGADIIKLQTAGRATLVNSPDFPYFPCWNRSKRSLAIDMKASGALDAVRKLVEQADVLVENYSAGVLDRWGLDYETVRSWNPGIVYVTMAGCGHAGPWKNVISYAPTVHALCGLTYLSNPPDRGDVGAGFSLNDHAAGFLAASSILAALESRAVTGLGQHVDIAQLEVGAYLVGASIMDHLSNGREAHAIGNADAYGTFLVNEVFVTSDGEVAVTVRDERDADAASALIGGPLDQLPAWCAARTGRRAMEALQGVGVPAGRVQNGHHLFTDDEQLRARELFGTLASDVFGDRPFDRFPARFSEQSLEPYRPAPNYLGEHAFEILGEFAGMSEEDVAIAMGDGLLG